MILRNYMDALQIAALPIALQSLRPGASAADGAHSKLVLSHRAVFGFLEKEENFK